MLKIEREKEREEEDERRMRIVSMKCLRVVRRVIEARKPRKEEVERQSNRTTE